MFVSVVVILIFNAAMVLANSIGRDAFNLTLLSAKTQTIMTLLIMSNALISFLFEKVVNKFA